MRFDVAREVARCCREMVRAGLIAGRDGNVSVRLAEDRILATPSGTRKADLTPQDMVEVDLQGRRLRGSKTPSSELDLHLTAYRARPDVGAVVHAHPPTATAYGIACHCLDQDVLPELRVLVGPVPVVPYATPGTPRLGEKAAPLITGANALILANHGALTLGSDLTEAWIRMESLEHAARILSEARRLGSVNRLSLDELAKLDRMRGPIGDAPELEE